MNGVKINLDWDFKVKGTVKGTISCNPCNHVGQCEPDEDNGPTGAFQILVNIKNQDKKFTIPFLNKATSTARADSQIMIDWGDTVLLESRTIGSSPDIQLISHTYSNNGQYTIKIYGNIPRIVFSEKPEFDPANPLPPQPTDNQKQLIEVLDWGTNKWTNFDLMFASCTELKKVAKSVGTDTSQVTSMTLMFAGCVGLQTIDISLFDTRNVTSTFGMFGFCATLKDPKLPVFRTDKMTNMAAMFSGCSNLTTLTLATSQSPPSGGSRDEMEIKIDMQGMFDKCTGLTTLDLMNFDTSKASNMSVMFQDCSVLNNLDLSTFDTSSVKNMNSMFAGCENMSNLTLPAKFVNTSVTNLSGMFQDCVVLNDVDLSTFSNTALVTEMRSTFENCRAFTSLDISKWSFSNVNDASNILDNSGITADNYNAVLEQLAQFPRPDGTIVNFGAVGVNTNDSTIALINEARNLGWNIVDMAVDPDM